jgi:hypothetical protein
MMTSFSLPKLERTGDLGITGMYELTNMNTPRLAHVDGYFNILQVSRSCPPSMSPFIGHHTSTPYEYPTGTKIDQFRFYVLNDQY